MKRMLGAIVLMLATSGAAQAQPAPPVIICSLQAIQAIKAIQAAKNAGLYAEALAIMRPCAERGDSRVEAMLGAMYAAGQGVPQDYAEAVRWYRLAAEQGYTTAQGLLGTMYGLGRGVPQDFILAHMWFNIAAANGEALAATERDRVAAVMTAAQIAEAQRLAREWFAAHTN